MLGSRLTGLSSRDIITCAWLAYRVSLPHVIGLKHDDVICLKFTPKPPLHEIFLETLSPSCSFHKVILCISVPLEVCILKVRLGGEIGYSDVTTHKGYWPLIYVHRAIFEG